MNGVGLSEKVFTFTEENSLFSAPCHVIVGVSGGADSMSLLHCLCRWPQQGLRVTAVHVHHGLRGAAADSDAAFVKTQCEALGVDVRICYTDAAAVATANGWSVEEAGRRERYRLFEEIRLECGADYILTAHTADDRVETVLMNLIRGCGVDGLRSIPASRGVICRPLLSCSRREVEAYCVQNGVAYVTDETNAQTCYTRNRVRHEVLPLLRQMNPMVDAALLRLSQHAVEDSSYLHEVAADTLLSARVDEGIYSLSPFTEAPLPIRRRMITRLLERLCLPHVEEKHILDIEECILRGGGGVILPTGVQIAVSQGMLSVVFPQAALPDRLSISTLPYSFSWGEQSFCVEYHEERENVHKKFLHYAVDYDKIQGGLYVRPRLEGDSFHPAGRGVGKSLKKQMIEWHIPAHLRDRIPLLFDEAGLLLIPGYACDERVRITEDTKHFLVCRPCLEQG
ncbi:MAG: tRNA lysidine(34) synthetase TilS [Clostridia bacterium]|nr:tRNA lysidine(34) synthetase TilS [Clostridia bacterium]